MTTDERMPYSGSLRWIVSNDDASTASKRAIPATYMVPCLGIAMGAADSGNPSVSGLIEGGCGSMGQMEARSLVSVIYSAWLWEPGIGDSGGILGRFWQQTSTCRNTPHDLRGVAGDKFGRTNGSFSLRNRQDALRARRDA